MGHSFTEEVKGAVQPPCQTSDMQTNKEVKQDGQQHLMQELEMQLLCQYSRCKIFKAHEPAV